jgi:DNA-binding XRE family transcriptional regulator
MEQNDLASASDVARSTIGAFETKDETARLSKRINRMLIEAFERAGLLFIPEDGGGPGVRFRDSIGDQGQSDAI